MANYSTRFDAFRNSLESLSKIETIVWPDDDDIKGFIWCGVIAKFSISFDLSWKLMKDILIQYHKVIDFAKGSPKEILRKSFEADIINDHTWAKMLEDRNSIGHQYKNLDTVDDWCGKIISNYIPLLYDLLKYAEVKLKELSYESGE